MPPKIEEKVQVAVPTGGKKRRLRIGLRDVGITLVIAVLILGILYAVNRPNGNSEGSFQNVPYTGGIPTGPAPTVGQPAPDFQLPLLGGGTFRLNDYKGKVVWINFWASWCPPCRAEAPDMLKVWNDVKGSNVVLVSIDFGEDKATASAFAQKLGMDYPIGLDSGSTVATNYRLAGLPSHFFVDKNGILREIRIGLLSEASMRQILKTVNGY